MKKVQLLTAKFFAQNLIRKLANFGTKMIDFCLEKEVELLNEKRYFVTNESVKNWILKCQNLFFLFFSE